GGSNELGDAGADLVGNDVPEKNPVRPRHRHSSSVDGSSSFGEIMDGKKAMPPDKLAELWSIDPKRAKRFAILIQNA
ncbi:transcription factor RF2b-like, partial [Trifolium medium]|nr:transcription factor RF2b-like [Trifolium medium]